MALPKTKRVRSDASVNAAATAAAAGLVDGKLPADLLGLAENWRERRRQGLDLRHLTGGGLNQLLGSPKGRQDYGKAVLKQFSDCAGIAESDLSRMRWFHHHFPSLADFRDKHPQATTWHQVKQLLPRLRPGGEGASAAAEGRLPADTGPGRGRQVRSVVRALNAARERLAGLALKPSDPERPQLVAECERLLASVAECTGVRYVRLSEDVPPAARESDPACVGAGVMALVS